MKSKVYIVGADAEYEQMFLRNGWQVVKDIEDSDLIQFTGGSDVDPMLYGEPYHPATGSSPARDAKEANIFNKYNWDIPMAGICRGGQFLNVMSGGRMWQHVDGHTVGGGHTMYDIVFGKEVLVSSTHHQMMDPTTADNYLILATAGLTTFKQDGWGNSLKQLPDRSRDVEAVFFPETQCLSYQPHPEFFNEHHECQKLYFEYIRVYLGLE